MDHRQPIKMRLRMITGAPTGKQPSLTYRQARQVLWRADSTHRTYGSGWTAMTQNVLERLLFMIAKNPDRTIPSTTWLAGSLRISRRSVVNHINRLVQHGLLQKHERHAVWEDTITRQTVRVRTSNQYTPGKTLLGWLRDLVAGGGVVQESGGKTDQKYINKIDPIRRGLTRQAEIAIAWLNRKRELELEWISDHRQRWLPLPDLSG